MERARRRESRKIDSRAAGTTLQNLLETIVKGISSGVTVSRADGHGFVHFEIRGSEAGIERLRGLSRYITTVMKVAGRVRRTRISIQYHDQGLEEAPSAGHIDDLERMVSALAKSMADNPDEVVVFPAAGDEFVHYDVRCDISDVGSLIGSRGAHASAMRALIEAAGHERNVRASLNIAARDGD